MFSFVDKTQVMDVLKHRSGIYHMSFYREHKFINKHVLPPETVFFVMFESNGMDEKSNVFDVEVGRCSKNISRITVMNCKECNEVCMNIISTDSQIINHQPVPLPIGVCMNRQKNYLAVVQCDDEGSAEALLFSTPIATDGDYTCTVKCEWRRIIFLKNRHELMIKCHFRPLSINTAVSGFSRENRFFLYIQSDFETLP